MKNSKCNVLYTKYFYILFNSNKRSSEKYTTDIKCIYYTNRTYLFGCILVYGSLLFLSSAHVMKQEISKGRNYFCFKYDKTDNSYPALIGKVIITPQKFYNSRFMLIFFLNFNIYIKQKQCCAIRVLGIVQK